MADLACTYTLTTPGGTINFNVGDIGDGTDKFWLQDIQGLDGAEVRAPVDNVPFGNGSIIHTFWKSGRRPVFEGVLLVETVGGSPTVGSACQTELNVLENALRVAIDSIVAADGTLAYTPTGQAAVSLLVRYPAQPRLDFRPIENFATRSFIFGLVSADPDL